MRGSTIALVLLLASCGARTGLRGGALADASSPTDVAVPDVSQPDVVVDAPLDAPPPFNGAVRIAATTASTCTVDSSGGVECWGDDASGELGNGATGTFNTPEHATGLATGVVAIAMSGSGACAVGATGDASCWGDNTYGQLGTGAFASSLTPAPVSGISAAVAVAGGGDYANCLLLRSGAVECVGGDYAGNLALGSITSQSYPTPQTSKVTSAVAIAGSGVDGSVANCAVLVNGRVQCWGFMAFSLGDGSTAASGAPFTVPGITDAIQVAASGQNICIVSADGTLACWGENLWGEVGDGTTTNQHTPVTTTLTHVASVSVGHNHTCAVTSAGAVACVGDNATGQLGNGTTSSSTTWQQAVASGAVGVACGGAHTCALMASGKVACWGDNTFGQVGDGTNTERDVPVSVVGF
jgi:alpha-tubulin suppressor-like RCC1 family protein